ncbi:hypothetical protein S7711_08730 [Stachybotrys chartarum IBT 7711]|uniref:ML-like domain-containing protein n=1 Tax=Stachybotrys chartarum (strain CBS 109288 / IBT 7711) TaxID=1280523 RepID=A0A084AK27_STACB|nr:hypothetical protein S7711_08730 [Stachybotrys chartarum IBT 7711]
MRWDAGLAGLPGSPRQDNSPRTRNALPELADCVYGLAASGRDGTCSAASMPTPSPSPVALEPSSTRRHNRRASDGRVLPEPAARARRSASSTSLSKALVAALVAAAPASAVIIPFQNCLSESFRTNDPPFVQWVPIRAEAVFGHDDTRHSLRVTVWGNVTGAQNRGRLPPPDDPYWTNDDQFNGKIVRTADPDREDARATTLFRRVNVLTYQPWDEAVDFCVDGLVNASCPLAPVFNISDSDSPQGLPSFNLTHDFDSSYAFTSFSPELSIIYGDQAATTIGCISATITPDLGGLAWLLRFMPLLVLLFTATSVTMSGILSPWGTTDIFHWTSNFGRDADLLRLVTPGFGDCLQYIQFIVLSGGLSLNYPGFYQPIVSQAGWSALMFNASMVSQGDPFQSVVDGIYVVEGRYGLQRLSQLIGMSSVVDIWAGMMVWLCVIIASVFVLIQIGFVLQWLYRMVMNTTEEDLRAKNIPFSVGNVVRIVFNYFLLPIMTLSCFQLVIAGDSPTYTVALAAITLVVLLAFAAWLLYFIISTRPKAALFDDLPTVLRYGPLYNTYSDEAAAFALIPILLTLVRGIGIGAVQSSGIAQVVILTICEVIHILTLHAFRPFHSPTSMNAYHTLYSALRLITIMLMVAFSPTLGVDDGTKGWIGYVILVIHGAVLVLGFWINALQTVVEVVARMLGAGGDDVRGLTRGGLSKIFGMRQLSRRATPRPGPSRASQLSTAAMLDVEDGSKMGYSMPSGRVRSESAASLGGILAYNRRRNSSALDSIDIHSAGPRHMDTASSYMPGTPGEASTFSFLPSPSAARYPQPTMPLEAADPYYRPPRRRRDTLTDAVVPDKQRASASMDPKRVSQVGGSAADTTDTDIELANSGSPPPGGAGLTGSPSRPDYSTREVDFYYGVRGPALNSEGLGRKLGTGPADPTGPMATATGWFRNWFGGKSKEKGKGFEVVRSARMPPSMMARNGGFGDETPPEGIPVALKALRNMPIESDDENDAPRTKRSPPSRKDNLLTDDGDPQDSEADEPESPLAERAARSSSRRAQGARVGDSARVDDDTGLDLPEIPRKSSKRHSAYASHSPSIEPADSHDGSGDVGSPSGRPQLLTISRLPFERSGSLKHSGSNSSMELTEDYNQIELLDAEERRGTVPHHGINRVDVSHHNIDLLGSSAELVDETTARRRSPRI